MCKYIGVFCTNYPLFMTKHMSSTLNMCLNKKLQHHLAGVAKPKWCPMRRETDRRPTGESDGGGGNGIKKDW